MTRPQAVLFDLDGTLADVSGLRHYVEGRNKNFDAFHKASVLCPTIPWVVDEVWRHWDAARKVVIVTARQEQYWGVTEDWLSKHRIPFDVVMMRDAGDGRRDYDVKSDILGKLRVEYDIRHAYDDNPSTYRLWLEHGIPTTIVPGWDIRLWPREDRDGLV